MRIGTTMPSHLINQGNNGTIAGVRLPNFNYMLTKSTPKLSDEAIRNKIIEMAKRDAATSVYRPNEEEFHKLSNMFISSVSPDRKSAITNALTSLKTNINMLQKASSSHKSIGEWLDLLLGRALLNENFTVNHLSVTDSSGNEIAFFNEYGGWRFEMTDAEWSRASELRDLYQATWNAARNEMQTPQTAGNAGQNANVQNGKPTVDIMGMVIEPPAIDVKT